MQTINIFQEMANKKSHKVDLDCTFLCPPDSLQKVSCNYITIFITFFSFRHEDFPFHRIWQQRLQFDEPCLNIFMFNKTNYGILYSCQLSIYFRKWWTKNLTTRLMLLIRVIRTIHSCRLISFKRLDIEFFSNHYQILLTISNLAGYTAAAARLDSVHGYIEHSFSQVYSKKKNCSIPNAIYLYLSENEHVSLWRRQLLLWARNGPGDAGPYSSLSSWRNADVHQR
jgi:hypothetical protein